MNDEFDIFLFLGIQGSGRLEVIDDIIDGYYSADQQISVLYDHREDIPSRSPFSNNVELVAYKIVDEQIKFPSAIPQSNILLILCNGSGNCIEFLEAIQKWTRNKKMSVNRVISIIHTQKVMAEPKIARWYDATIHFSDVALLNRRENVGDKDIRQFVLKYNKEKCMPCLFEFVKKGKIKNPAIALEGSPRRISQAFEEEDDFDYSEVIITDENDEENPEEDDFMDEFRNAPEPYFKRLPNGRHEIEIPDISDCLGEIISEE
jgi:hypothetical protein